MQVEQYVERAEEIKIILKTKRPITVTGQQGSSVRLLGKGYKHVYLYSAILSGSVSVPGL